MTDQNQPAELEDLPQHNNVDELPEVLVGDPDLGKISERLQKAIDDHSTTVDAWAYNTSTILALSFAAAASVLPSINGGELTWLAQIFAALSGTLIAIDRALNFGQRWMYHRELKSGYQWVGDMLEFYKCLPPSQKPRYLSGIWNDLYALRRRENTIPGVSTINGPRQNPTN